MIIVDSTVWVDYFQGLDNKHTDYLDRKLGSEPIALTDVILCEVLQGMGDEASFQRLLREFRNFAVFETGGAALAVAAARNFRVLRRRGCTVRKTIDCLIATFCLIHGYALLHRDRDFDHFERFLHLSVIHL